MHGLVVLLVNGLTKHDGVFRAVTLHYSRCRVVARPPRDIGNRVKLCYKACVKLGSMTTVTNGDRLIGDEAQLDTVLGSFGTSSVGIGAVVLVDQIHVVDELCGDEVLRVQSHVRSPTPSALVLSH